MLRRAPFAAIVVLAGLTASWPGRCADASALERPDDALRARVLAIDPERVGADEVRDLLSHVPAPRILLFRGSLAADMESFGAFLQRMGYPDERLRDPATGRYSRSFDWRGCHCEGCERAAADIAGDLQRRGLSTMLIGHSGGGVAVSRILYALAGHAPPQDDVPPPSPAASSPPPLLQPPQVPFAAALGTGALLRGVPGFPGCRADIPRLGLVPASAREFTGMRIAGDPFTSVMGFGDYRPIPAGPTQARVRNLRLSAQVSHVRAFEVDGYADDAAVRAWIEAYRPGTQAPLPVSARLDLANLPHVADLWHSIKRQWALGARQWATHPDPSRR